MIGRLFSNGWLSLSWGGFFALGAGVPVSLWLFGFTVDDALISIRVAQNLATGSGYRFNSSGPVVDAVTPLGWAPMLTLLYDPSPWVMLFSARLLGLLAWWLTLVVLGQRMAALGPGHRRWLPLVPLAVSAPLAVWSSSGMETALVTLMATLAVCRGRSWLILAGLAAAWRPELLGWAVVLGLGRGLSAPTERRASRLGSALLSVVGPFVMVALLRVVVFGQAAPLSAIAKPTELSQGISYALNALVWTGFPLLLVARGVRRLPLDLTVVGLAALSHFLFVALVGGDWMTLYRLMVPVLPSLILVGSEVCRVSRWLQAGLRVGVATGLSVVLLVRLGPSARGVVEQRQRLSEQAEPFLSVGGTVGALDVGWVGASTSSEVFDFAGVTDPEIARLCCGHHAKKIEQRVIETRGVSTLVLLLAPGQPLVSPWWQSQFARFSENYVARQLRDEPWFRVAEFKLGSTDQRYVVLRRSMTRTASIMPSASRVGSEVLTLSDPEGEQY